MRYGAISLAECGNADSHKVAFGHTGEVGRGLEATVGNELRKVLLHDVSDIVLAGVNLVDLRLLDIETNGLVASLGLLDRQRQANVAESNGATNERAILDGLFNLSSIHKQLPKP